MVACWVTISNLFVPRTFQQLPWGEHLCHAYCFAMSVTLTSPGGEPNRQRSCGCMDELEACHSSVCAEKHVWSPVGKFGTGNCEAESTKQAYYTVDSSHVWVTRSILPAVCLPTCDPHRNISILWAPGRRMTQKEHRKSCEYCLTEPALAKRNTKLNDLFSLYTETFPLGGLISQGGSWILFFASELRRDLQSNFFFSHFLLPEPFTSLFRTSPSSAASAPCPRYIISRLRACEDPNVLKRCMHALKACWFSLAWSSNSLYSMLAYIWFSSL